MLVSGLRVSVAILMTSTIAPRRVQAGSVSERIAPVVALALAILTTADHDCAPIEAGTVS